MNIKIETIDYNEIKEHTGKIVKIKMFNRVLDNDYVVGILMSVSNDKETELAKEIVVSPNLHSKNIDNGVKVIPTFIESFEVIGEL